MKKIWKMLYSDELLDNTFNSITLNIKNILNTRSSLTLQEFMSIDNNKLTTIYFGLPNFTHLSMYSVKDKNLLCRSIEKSIQVYEHRLSYVEAKFSNYDKIKREAKLSIKAVYHNKDIVVNLLLKIAFWEFLIDDWQA